MEEIATKGTFPILARALRLAGSGGPGGETFPVCTHAGDAGSMSYSDVDSELWRYPLKLSRKEKKKWGEKWGPRVSLAC